MSCKIRIVFVVAHFPEETVRVPRRTRTNYFSISGSKRKEYGVKQVLVVRREVGFIPPNTVKRMSPDSVRIVWKSFNHTAVGKG